EECDGTIAVGDAEFGGAAVYMGIEPDEGIAPGETRCGGEIEGRVSHIVESHDLLPGQAASERAMNCRQNSDPSADLQLGNGIAKLTLGKALGRNYLPGHPHCGHLPCIDLMLLTVIGAP